MEKIEFELSKDTYYTGQKVKGNIRLKNIEPFEANSIDLRLIGVEETEIDVIHGRALGKYRESNSFLNSHEVLWNPKDEESRILEPDSHEFPFSFRIPEYAHPSYSGTHASISYKLRLEVDSPSWKGKAEEHEIRVYKNLKSLGIATDPVHFWSDNYFSMEDEGPSFYVQLAKTGYRAGETMAGFITLKNLDSSDIKKIVLELTGFEFAMAHGFKKSVSQGKTLREIPTEDIKSNVPVYILFSIPKGLPSSYQGMYSRFRWVFAVRLDTEYGWIIKATRPVEILY